MDLIYLCCHKTGSIVELDREKLDKLVFDSGRTLWDFLFEHVEKKLVVKTSDPR